jgi:WD40 repeat protein
MKKTILWTTVFVLIALSVAALSPQSAQDLFQKALTEERAEGNLEEAIAIYQKISEESADETLAAEAQLRIGICYEKLGRTEALKAYQAVIERFPNQSEQVAEARARLAELEMNDEGAIPKNHLYSSVHDNFYLEYQSLSPDSTRLLGVDFHAGQNVVYKDLASGKFVNVTNFDWKSEGHGWTYSPVWSRDGRRIAFRFGGWENPIEELRITDLNGDSRTIYRCEVKEETIYPVDWFPGESTILAIHTDKDKAIRLGTIPVQGGDFNLLYAIAPHKGANFRAGAGDIVRPDLSPNGKFIAFHELKDGATDIFILDIAKKTVKPIMDSPANNEQPSWSPDGKYIAFMSDRSGTRTIWAVAMNEDGTANGEPFLIRPGQSITLKDWTTQGLCYEEWISMVDIFIMPVDPASGAPCGKPRQLDFRPTGRNSFPRWSPDGKHLAFVANPTGAAGDFQIVVYPLSEGEARTYKAPSPRIGGVDPPALLDLCWLPDSSGISYSALVPHGIRIQMRSALSSGIYPRERSTMCIA